MSNAALPSITGLSELTREPAAGILIVDDHASVRASVRDLVEAAGWTVSGEAVNGQEAIGMAATIRPSLVIMDISMPVMDGLQATRRIRSLLPETPVVIITQHGSDAVEREALKAGARGLILKSQLASDLLPALDSASQRPERQARPAKRPAKRPRSLSQQDDDRHGYRDAQLLASIVASSDDAIVSKNLDGIITSWNQSAERIFGYSAAEAVGRSITLIIPPERQSEEADILARIRRGEPIDHFQTVRVRKDGALIDVSVTISPVRDASGRVVGASKVARDITEKKRAQEALRQYSERFNLITEATQIGIWLCDLPFDKLRWDSRVKEHFWLPPDAEVTIELFYQRLHPDDHERVRTIIESCIANNKAYDIEYRTVAPDGRCKWIRAIGRVFYDEAGQPKRFDGLTMDVTARRMAEEREQQITAESIAATAKFRAVFEQTTIFAGIMSKEGVVVELNRLFLEACGAYPEQVVGRHCWDAPCWRHFPKSRDKIRAATPLAAQGIPYRELLHYSPPDGAERLVDFALYPITGEKDEILFLHLTGVDITDVKRTQENYRRLAETLEDEVEARTLELEQRNLDVTKQSELLREFSQRLLHAQDEERRHIARELHDSAGQTLTVLGINLAQLVQKAGRKAPEIALQAEMIQETVQQLHREIRTTSYLLHPPLLDESGLASALSWYTQGLTERSGLEIDLDISEDFARLPREMELVIFRLVQEGLTNIHRHSGGNNAFIRIARERDAVGIVIRDDGHGIATEKLAELHSGGSGVGIRGMRERVNQFGGSLKIESDDCGTRVVVTIPLGNVASGEKTATQSLPAAV